VAHTYNPKFSGSWNQEDQGSRLAWAKKKKNSLWDPHLNRKGWEWWRSKTVSNGPESPCGHMKSIENEELSPQHHSQHHRSFVLSHKDTWPLRFRIKFQREQLSDLSLLGRSAQKIQAFSRLSLQPWLENLPMNYRAWIPFPFVSRSQASRYKFSGSLEADV
jgi:hypothetical protein